MAVGSRDVKLPAGTPGGGVYEGVALDFGMGDGVSVRPGVAVAAGILVGKSVGVVRIDTPMPSLGARNNPPPTMPPITNSTTRTTAARSSAALESPTRPRRFFI